jgi:hypothetical protein
MALSGDRGVLWQKSQLEPILDVSANAMILPNNLIGWSGEMAKHE